MILDDHAVFCRQAEWTRSLRAYLFACAGLVGARRVLEVGCGTGAVLGELAGLPGVYGLDIRLDYLLEGRSRLEGAQLVCGDALALPYPDGIFEAVFCHYFLLWVKEPLAALLEMRRVTRAGGWILALAEPDYAHRLDRPLYLAPLGRWQRRALQRRGADPDVGARLKALFRQAGLRVLEAGILRSWEATGSEHAGEQEWAILTSDLRGYLPNGILQGMRFLDALARRRGKRLLFVPTHFAIGQAP